MTDNHTPLPWAVDPDDRPDMEWSFHIVQADDPNIRIAFMCHPNGEANAAYIVQACNAYPVLKAENAALKERVAELETLVECLIDNDPNDMAADGVTVLEVWRKDARATLSKAKGGNNGD